MDDEDLRHPEPFDELIKSGRYTFDVVCGVVFYRAAKPAPYVEPPPPPPSSMGHAPTRDTPAEPD